MELDELKEAWTALDNHLNKKDDLKENIILDMMKRKTGKLVNKIIALEAKVIVIAFLVLILCIFQIYRSQGFIENIFPLFLVAVCFFHFFVGGIKIHGLMKINLSNDVGSNFNCMNRYSKQLKRERKIYLFSVLIPSILFLIIFLIAGILNSKFCFIYVLPFLYWSYLLGTSNNHKNIGLIIKNFDKIRTESLPL